MSLTDSDQMLEHLSALGVAIYAKDLQGRYLAINREGADLLGRTQEEILGGTDYDLFTPRDAQITIVRDRFVLCQAEPLVFCSTAHVSATDTLTAFHSVKIALRHRPRRLPVGLLGLSFVRKGTGAAERENVARLVELAQKHPEKLLARLRRQGTLLAV